MLRPAKVCPVFGCQQLQPCPTHAKNGKTKSNNKWVEDPDAYAFYHSMAWRRLSAQKRYNTPVCERCNKAMAQIIHHMISRRARPELALVYSNLMAVCRKCHMQIESDIKRDR